MYYYTAFDNKILLQQIVIHKEKNHISLDILPNPY